MSEPLDWTAVRREPIGARPAPVIDMATAYPNPVGAPNQRAPRRRTGLVVGLVVAVVMLVAAGGIGAYLFTRPAAPNAAAQAIAACEASVKGQLKAPATAQFSGEHAVQVGTDAWDVSGNVDAQSSFGALLRQNWTCSALRFVAGWDATATVYG